MNKMSIFFCPIKGEVNYLSCPDVSDGRASFYYYEVRG